MAIIKLYMNEFGLLRTKDGLWGIREVSPKHWAIQNRKNADDPWGWEILSYKHSKEEAIAYLATYPSATIEFEGNK